MENTIERCMILTEKEMIDLDALPVHIKNTDGTTSFKSDEVLFTEESPVIPFEKLKEEAIRHALKVTNGNIVDAAKKLKVGRATFYRLMDKFNINSPKKSN